MSPRSDALLRELRSRNVAHTLNKSGELVLGRKLPADLVELLPTEMIPSSVLRWHSEYKEGLMTKELLGAPRFHSRVAALRRYHLIAHQKTDPGLNARLNRGKFDVGLNPRLIVTHYNTGLHTGGFCLFRQQGLNKGRQPLALVVCLP